MVEVENIVKAPIACDSRHESELKGICHGHAIFEGYFYASHHLKMLEAKLAEAGTLKKLLDGESLTHIFTRFSPI